VTAPPEPTALDRAADAAASGRPELAQAWALIAIAEEVKQIRQEMHRAARSRVRVG
jgi:hypothetical protein